jgi:hypothetical protein
MNYIRHLNSFFEISGNDNRLTAYHISLYMALFQQWNRNRFRDSFPVDREELMQLSRIGSKNTYAKCMKQLHQWGYIHYTAKGNLHTGWKVSCTGFDTGSGTGGDTGTGTGDGTGSGTVYKDINNTNITNGNKQAHSKNLKNGREKENRNTNPLHVNTDKDYAEPL